MDSAIEGYLSFKVVDFYFLKTHSVDYFQTVKALHDAAHVKTGYGPSASLHLNWPYA
jgi:hypothetical protein